MTKAEQHPELAARLKAWSEQQLAMHRGKGAVPNATPASPPPSAMAAAIGRGVGTELAKLLKRWGFDASTCSTCQELVNLWDGWGVDECERRRHELESTLIARAKRRRWLLGVGATLTAGKFVELAIANARAAAAAKPAG